ncbi:MAG: hypothetical protein D3904_04445 [Candidatus Electrothrix sp. EH2]|nr:hypothetical protein [Candidatus Electrothrix sp. EH2]
MNVNFSFLNKNNPFERVTIHFIRSIIRGWTFFWGALDLFIPKKDNLVVFSQKQGRYYDNGRALFEYMAVSSDWKVAWLASDKSIQKKIKNAFPHAFVPLRLSFSAMWITLRAKYIVVTYSLHDVFPWHGKSKRTVTIQLWHAITIKGYGVIDKKFNKKKINRYLAQETSLYNLVITSSEIDKYTTAACTGVNAKKIIPTGLPRNDILYQEKKNKLLPDDVDLSLHQAILNNKIILYAPTFRDNGTTEFFPFDDYNIEELKIFLIEYNAAILIRPHQNDFENQKRLHTLIDKTSGEFLSAGNNQVSDINSLLPHIDIIVTDYSSIYVDLLIRDTPPIFIPYDLATYEQERGLAYPYEIITPGPKVFTQSDFLAAIKDALNGAPRYKKDREMVRRLFHKYNDGKSCERIVAAMKNL